MSTSQHFIEQRLAEFTEVHGTVLLGMHRELQSQVKKVDDILATAAMSLNEEVERSRKELRESGRKLTAKYAGASNDLERAVAVSRNRDTELRSAMEAHSSHVTDLVRQSEEEATRAQRTVLELVERVRDEANGMVNGAINAIDRHQQTAVAAFKESHAAFTQEIETAETKVVAFMVAQQQMLDGHAKRIESLHVTTQQMLGQVNAKIQAHQRREAEFNRRVRIVVMAVFAVASIAVIVVMWKPWLI